MYERVFSISTLAAIVLFLASSDASATGFPKPGEELTCSEQMIFEDSCGQLRRSHRLVLTAEAALAQADLSADKAPILQKLVDAKSFLKEGMARRECPEYKNIDTAAEKIAVPVNDPRIYSAIRNCPEAFVAFQALRDALEVSSRADGIFFGLRVDARAEIRDAKNALRSIMRDAKCFGSNINQD